MFIKVRIFAGIPRDENVLFTSTQNGSSWPVMCCSCFVTAVFHIVSNYYTVPFLDMWMVLDMDFQGFFLLGLSGMTCC